jgi:hypothetical protein
MNTIQKISTSTKNFAVKHKTALTIAATVTITGALAVSMRKTEMQTYDNFLKDAGLYDQFIASLEEETV